MADQKFSGASLEQALNEGSLETSHGATELVAMVKKSEEPGHVSITTSGCEEWIDIPTDMIEEAEVIGSRPCRDHEHPLARITLKAPTSDESRLLAALLRQTTRAQRIPPEALPQLAGLGRGRRFAMAQRGPGGGGLPPRGGFWWPPLGCYWDCIVNYANCRTIPEVCDSLFSFCLSLCDSPLVEDLP